MIRYIFLTFCFYVAFLSSFAETRSLSDARRIAASFTNSTDGFAPSAVDDFVPAIYDRQNRAKSLKSSSPGYYILNMEGGGYVIVSGDDRFRDILGYSTTGCVNIDEMPDGMQSLLSNLSSEMQSARSYYDENGITEIERPSALFTSTHASVAPLIKTHWGQYYPLNAQVPIEYDGVPSLYRGRATIGCVALAMAQVMNKWKYPSAGQGGVHYNSTYDNISVNFDEQTYDWNNLAAEYGKYADDEGTIRNGSYTQSQADEIAKICYHSGVAVNMVWNSDGHGSSGTIEDYIPYALITYFGYNRYAKLRYRDAIGINELSTEIINDLSAGRPVIFTAESNDGGHAFVLDGYDSATDMFHVNWGWQGLDNGYYALTALKPATETHVFHINQLAVLGVQPVEKDFGYEPSVYYKKLVPSQTSFNKGNSLMVGIDTLVYSDAIFKGKIGLAIYSSDGNMLLENISSQYKVGYIYIKESLYTPTFPKSMSAGSYTMRMVMRDEDGTVYPMHAKYGHPESWTVTVSSNAPDGTITIVADDPVVTRVEDMYVTSPVSSDGSYREGSDTWFTVTGIPVSSPGKGIFIRGGKKYFFR